MRSLAFIHIFALYLGGWGCQKNPQVYCRTFFETRGVGVSETLLDFKVTFQRIAKRAGGKGPRQKTSKVVKKCQKVFRHSSTFFAQGKKTSKLVKKCQTYFRHFSTIFARHHFSGSFWGALNIHDKKYYAIRNDYRQNEVCSRIIYFVDRDTDRKLFPNKFSCHKRCEFKALRASSAAALKSFRQSATPRRVRNSFSHMRYIIC